MAIKFEKVKAGDVLWSRTRDRMGNTMMSRWGWREVYIVSVDEKGAFVHWNVRFNPKEFWDRRRIEKLFAAKGCDDHGKQKCVPCGFPKAVKS